MLEEAHAKSHRSGRGEQRKTLEKSGMADWERKGSGENQGKKDQDGDSRLGIRWICSPRPKIPQEFRDNARLPCLPCSRHGRNIPEVPDPSRIPKIPSPPWTESHSCKNRDIPRMFPPPLPGFSYRIPVVLCSCSSHPGFPWMLPPRNTRKRFSQRDIPRNSCWWGSGMSQGIPLDQPHLNPGEFFIPAFSRDPKMLPQDLFQHLGISQQLRDPFGTSGILGPVGNVEILDPPGRGVGKIPPPPIPEGNVFIPFVIPPFPRILPT